MNLDLLLQMKEGVTHDSERYNHEIPQKYVYFLHIQHPQRRHAILKYLIPTIDLEKITTNF